MKKYIFLIILILSVSLSYAETYDSVESIGEYTETAVVLEAHSVNEAQDSDEGFLQEQYVELKILSGKYKDQVFEINNQLSGHIVYDIAVETGDKVVVLVEETEDGKVNVFISDYMRQHFIMYLAIAFVILIVLVGKTKGVKSVITLALTLFTIVKILLPAILNGMNPIPLTIVLSIFITVITLFIIAGINAKSISAIIGTVIGVLVAGFLAYIVGTQVKLTGMSSEEAIMLMYIPQNISFDFKGLLFSGIIMGALGAVMDVGMSIASAIEEIHNANPSLTQKQLFSSGMNVGRDVMGTMTNTLILAYTGSSIPLLLLFMSYETSIIKISNLDVIATEVVRSLAGSIGLVIAIPVTALVTSFFMKRKTDKKQVLDTRY